MLVCALQRVQNAVVTAGAMFLKGSYPGKSIDSGPSGEERIHLFVFRASGLVKTLIRWAGS